MSWTLKHAAPTELDFLNHSLTINIQSLTGLLKQLLRKLGCFQRIARKFPDSITYRLLRALFGAGRGFVFDSVVVGCAGEFFGEV